LGKSEKQKIKRNKKNKQNSGHFANNRMSFQTFKSLLFLIFSQSCLMAITFPHHVWSNHVTAIDEQGEQSGSSQPGYSGLLYQSSEPFLYANRPEISRHVPKYYPQYPVDVDSFQQWEDEASDQEHEQELPRFPSILSADKGENSLYADVIGRNPQLLREGLLLRKLDALLRDHENSGAEIMKRRGDNKRVRNLGMGF